MGSVQGEWQRKRLDKETSLVGTYYHGVGMFSGGDNGKPLFSISIETENNGNEEIDNLFYAEPKDWQEDGASETSLKKRYGKKFEQIYNKLKKDKTKK